jgi:hypothetical protein
MKLPQEVEELFTAKHWKMTALEFKMWIGLFICAVIVLIFG